METGGFELWKEGEKVAWKGDQESLNKMEEYNIKDVTLRRSVSKNTFLDYSHPNMGLHIGENVTCCATCGGTDLTVVGTYRCICLSMMHLGVISCGSD